MFIIDDLIKEFTAAFVRRLETNRDNHDAAIAATKAAMRCLSASFGEVIGLFQARSHQLRRLMAAGEDQAFWTGFAELVDADRLRSFCNAAGICAELDTARDRLLALPAAADSRERQLIAALATEISSQEWAFVHAIQEYLARATALDLLVVASERQVSPREACEGLEACITGLCAQKNSLDQAIERIREQTLRAWI